MEAEPCTNVGVPLTTSAGTSLFMRPQRSRSKAAFQPPLLHLRKADIGSSGSAPCQQLLHVHGHCRRAWLAAFFIRGRERKQPLRTSLSNIGHEMNQSRGDRPPPGMACFAVFPQTFFIRDEKLYI